MEAKDTIMDDTTAMLYEHIRIGNAMDISHELEAQAEISFKAGQESVPEPWDREQTVFGDGKQAGIREVFEFFHNNSAGIMMNEYALAAKLKEWGLKGDD